MEQEALRKQGENRSNAVSRNFAAKLGAFAAKGATTVRLGKTAHMPTFSVDPVSHLVNDLRTLQSTRELENDREILQFFKQAVAAADEAVDSELKANAGKLLGKTRMRELQSVVALKCWQVFDGKLSKHKWLDQSTHYKTHKALTQTETLDSRMARFVAANEQRLASHFKGALERCESSYKAKKLNLAMPVNEKDIDAEHRHLATSARDMLEEQGRDLVDTDAFKAALRSLNAVLSEGFEHVQQKNIELWKVHSDEATRCAIQENQAYERQCGLFCLYNKVPRVHKAVSQKHFEHCLARVGQAARMSPAMQLQVFESWYAKDLAADAAAVWNNFYIGTALVGLMVLVVCGFSGMWNRGAYMPHGGAPYHGMSQAPYHPAYQQAYQQVPRYNQYGF